MDTTLIPFHERLRMLRDAKELTQAELAALSGIEQGHISKLERGDIPNPNLETLLKLATALGVTMSWLLSSKPRGDNGE